jgi:hypothetical protein
VSVNGYFVVFASIRAFGVSLQWSSYFGQVNRWVELPIYARKHWRDKYPGLVFSRTELKKLTM